MAAKVVSAEQWAGIRALAEGELPSYGRLAACSGLHHTSIAQRAAKEDWNKLDCRNPNVVAAFRAAVEGRDVTAPDAPAEALPEGWQEMSQEQRLAWLSELIGRQVAQVASAAETGRGAFDKARLDGLWSLIRMVEKSDALAQERAANQETADDAELAARLRKLDDRIVELARAHAEWLVSGGDRA